MIEHGEGEEGSASGCESVLSLELHGEGVIEVVGLCMDIQRLEKASTNNLEEKRLGHSRSFVTTVYNNLAKSSNS